MMTQMLKDTVAKDALVKEDIQNRSELRTKRAKAEKSFLSKGPGFQPGLAYSSMQYNPKWAEVKEGGNIVLTY